MTYHIMYSIGEERKDEEMMTVTMANLTPDDRDNKRMTTICSIYYEVVKCCLCVL